MRNAVAWTLILSVSGICAEGDGQPLSVDKSVRNLFAAGEIDPDLRWIRKYGTFPDAIAVADNDLRVRIGEFVAQESKSYLSSDIIPEQKFIAENIMLLRAGGSTPDQEDIAFLRYRIAQDEFLIAMTTGFKARLFLFVHPSVATKEPFNISKYQRSQANINGVAAIALENGGCLIINKNLNHYENGKRVVPSHIAYGSLWFKNTLMQIVQERVLSKKRERRRLGSDEYVKSLLKKIPEGDSAKKEFEDEYLSLNQKIDKFSKNASAKEDLIQRRATVIEDMEGYIVALDRVKITDKTIDIEAFSRQRVGDQDYVEAIVERIPDREPLKKAFWDQYVSLNQAINSSPPKSEEREKILLAAQR